MKQKFLKFSQHCPFSLVSVTMFHQRKLSPITIRFKEAHFDAAESDSVYLRSAARLPKTWNKSPQEVSIWIHNQLQSFNRKILLSNPYTYRFTH